MFFWWSDASGCFNAWALNDSFGVPPFVGHPGRQTKRVGSSWLVLKRSQQGQGGLYFLVSQATFIARAVPVCPGVPVNSIAQKPNGYGSKNRYQNGTLISGNMDQHLRNPSSLILSHCQIDRFGLLVSLWSICGGSKLITVFQAPSRSEKQQAPNQVVQGSLKNLHVATI